MSQLAKIIDDLAATTERITSLYQNIPPMIDHEYEVISRYNLTDFEHAQRAKEKAAGQIEAVLKKMRLMQDTLLQSLELTTDGSSSLEDHEEDLYLRAHEHAAKIAKLFASRAKMRLVFAEIQPLLAQNRLTLENLRVNYQNSYIFWQNYLGEESSGYDATGQKSTLSDEDSSGIQVKI